MLFRFLQLLLMFSFILGVVPSTSYALNMSVDLVVIDEKGQPLEGVDVGVTFERNTGSGTKVYPENKTTDKEGRASFSGSGNGHIAYGSEQDGYYPSNYTYDFRPEEHNRKELIIILRPKTNPVPMYAKNAGMATRLALPERVKDIGFDLVVGDWVSPYGKGVHSDFIFNLQKSFSDRKNFSSLLTLKFSNANDGILKTKDDLSEGSIFKLPRLAPETGYESHVVFSRVKENGIRRINYEENDNFIFKVRSDRGGPMFGKLHGPVHVSGLKKDSQTIYFKYYLNPDGTRNLEFDPNRNLFKGLPNAEQVRRP